MQNKRGVFFEPTRRWQAGCLSVSPVRSYGYIPPLRSRITPALDSRQCFHLFVVNIAVGQWWLKTKERKTNLNRTVKAYKRHSRKKKKKEFGRTIKAVYRKRITRELHLQENDPAAALIHGTSCVSLASRVYQTNVIYSNQ